MKETRSQKQKRIENEIEILKRYFKNNPVERKVSPDSNISASFFKSLDNDNEYKTELENLKSQLEILKLK